MRHLTFQIRHHDRVRALALPVWWIALATSAQAAEIQGWVRLAGPRPAEEFQPVFKHREFCGERMASERIRVGSERGLADVLVTLEDVPRSERSPAPRTAVLDNRTCRFVPRVQAVPVGTRLEVRNSDPILHTVHAYLGTETLFHLALPVFRQRVWATLDRPGLVRVECDVGHTWMRAYILVRNDALATVTGPDGEFHLTGVPAGTFRLRTWHESLGTQEVSVTATEGHPTAITLLYAAPSN